MKVIVTGGAGFIGAHTAKRLIEEGNEVILVDNFNEYYDPALKEARITRLLAGLDHKLYRIDITDLESMRKVFQEVNPDILVHQAAQAGVRYSLQNPFTYEHSNIRGTLVVLELCREFGVKKIVFASSSSVYGKRNRDSSPFSEDDRTDAPSSVYAATKKATEVLAYSYHSLYGISMVGLRYFTVFGPYGRPDMAPSKFAKNILEGNPIDVYGEGNMKRDFTYIDDIVDGIMGAIQKDFSFEIFNLGYGSPSGLLEFIKTLEESLGKKAIKKFLPMQQGDVFVTYADISKARDKLGFNPKISLKEGVERFASWYREYNSNS